MINPVTQLALQTPQCTGHPFLPDSEAPNWNKFLGVCLGDQPRIKWFSRYLGYCLTGSVEEDLMLLAVGPAGSGKTTALNAVMYAMGGGVNPSGYATVAASSLLTASPHRRNANEHTAGLVPLVGKRLVAINEVSEGEKWDDSMVKQLVSNEPIMMRHSGGTRAFSVSPTWKLCIRGNHMPEIQDSSDGVWRRIAVLEFGQPPSTKNRRLDKLLEAEAPGILAWMVRGAVEWRRVGLERPPNMSQAAETFKSDQDVLGEWLSACTEPGGFTTSTDLCDSFVRYAQLTRAPSPKLWGGMLRSKQIERGKNGYGKRGFALTLRPSATF